MLNIVVVLFDHSDLKHGYMNTFILSSMLSIDIIFHHLMYGYSAKQSSVQSQSVSLYFNIVCLVSFDHCAHGQDFLLKIASYLLIFCAMCIVPVLEVVSTGLP